MYVHEVEVAPNIRTGKIEIKVTNLTTKTIIVDDSLDLTHLSLLGEAKVRRKIEEMKDESNRN